MERLHRRLDGSVCIAASTRAMTAPETGAVPLTTRLTVEIETPASLATSEMVAVSPVTGSGARYREFID